MISTMTSLLPTYVAMNVFGLNTHGFQLARHKTSMSAEDLGSPELIEGRYFPDMAKYLEDLGALEVRIMLYSVRHCSLDTLGYISACGSFLWLLRIMARR
ncbi:hypothetical protein F5Y13DRAFT_170155 [Hypoxylon sp. FL1857]|nr:hypothetical protein F5Y13DRAFT_170155 [Hypoxylon sp. FL1857]